MKIPTNLESGDWRLVEFEPDTGLRRYELDLGNGTTIVRTEYYKTEELIEQNKQSLNDSTNKRWGDGKVVASIPLNTFFRELAPALNNHDPNYVKKWLNDSDNGAFRTFGGRV